MSTTLDDLLELDRASLRRLLEQGHPIDAEALRDREFHGVSLGLPKLVERLTWKKFKKVFVGQGERLVGYNEAVERNALHEPWITRRRRDRPVRYGPFAVEPSDDGPLTIDYGPPAGRLDPMRLVRDPLVAVNPGSVELLLGVSLLAIGRGRVWTPTWFALVPGVPLGES